MPDVTRRRREGTQPYERVVPVVESAPAEADEPLAPPPAALDFAPRRAVSNGVGGRNGNGALPAPRSLPDMRSQRAARMERAERGDREPLRAEARGDVGPLIDELHTVFEHDRAVASQGSNARCGICYLHFTHADLTYREAEGFYVCAQCSRSLGNTQVMMIRRQQR
jgi:hypothetical protein